MRTWYLAGFCFASLYGCATTQQREVGVPLTSTSNKAAPAPWQQVQVVSIAPATGEVAAFAVLPQDALGQALSRRLGNEGARPVTLQITGLRVVRSSDTMATRLGIGADFTLSKDGQQKTLRLEHSVNLMNPMQSEHENGYARLVDDLCDRLFYNSEALAFLGESSVSVADSALESGAKDLGPIQGTQASANDIQGSGRILWGDDENANNGVFTMMLGDQKMFAGYMANRQSNWRNGVGLRSGVGFALMPGTTSSTTVAGQTIDTSSPTFVGLALQVGAEFGYHGVHRSPEGYITSPGLSALLVPQMQGFWLFGNQDGTQITMKMATVGASGELDIPMGSSVGMTLALFVGGTAVSMSSGDFSYSSGFQRVVNPSFDFYVQTATGRTSIGLGLQTLAQAASSDEGASSATKNPMITFTFEDWVGRGMAYSKQNLDVLGVSAFDAVETLSSPQSAFYDPSGQLLMPAPVLHNDATSPASTIPSGWSVTPAPKNPTPVVAPTPLPEPPPTSVSAERRKLGLRFRDVTADDADTAALEAITGALITQVTPDSPASEAGLLAGDIILYIDGRAMADAEAIQQTVAALTAASVTRLAVWRDGNLVCKNVVMGHQSADVRAKAGALFDELEAQDPAGGCP